MTQVHNTVKAFAEASGFSEQMIRGHKTRSIHLGENPTPIHQLSDKAYTRLEEDFEELAQLSDEAYTRLVRAAARTGRTLHATLKRTEAPL